MAGETVNMSDAAPASAEQGSQRDRSTIEFPYGDLSFGLEVTRAIYSNAGLECSPDQLASFMNQTTSSGAFRTKISTARTFGLVETDRGRVRLTDNGRAAMDPAQELAAKVRAFLYVPLYRAIFEKYRGHLLPPAIALEREMVSLGVAVKQKDKARWAFERSAEQAGFFLMGRERLVEPISRPQAETIRYEEAAHTDLPTKPAQHGGGSGGSGNGGKDSDLHPFIQGLLNTLPPPDTNWKIEGRAKWLQAAANIFDLMYKGDGEVIVKVTKSETD